MDTQKSDIQTDEDQKKTDISWLDEAFDDKKEQEEMQAVQKSSRLGCLLIAVFAIVIIAISVCFIGLLGAIEGI